MKQYLALTLLAFIVLLTSCSSSDATAYKDLVFGMTLEDVQAKGYLASDQQSISEEGLPTYQLKFSDYAGINYEKAEVSFRDNKLAKVHLFNSTTDALKQREISKKITDYLTSNYGKSNPATSKIDGWKDEKRTFLLYIHSEFDEHMKNILINELSICSNDYYKAK